MLDSNLKEKLTTTKYEIKRLFKRLNSQSKRIRGLQEKLSQIIANHKYYISKRLPNVLKREKERVHFSTELKHARLLLKSFSKSKLVYARNNKNLNKHETRYIGFFTGNEMRKIRKFLNIDLRLLYILYQAKKSPHLKNKQLLFFTTDEARTLHHLLEKS